MKKLIQSKPPHPAIKLRRRAYRILKIAIANGTIPKIDSDTKCVDCGVPAMVYDHRDYSKPLFVEPVCNRCNNRRGVGEPRYPTPQDSLNAIVQMRKKWA